MTKIPVMFHVKHSYLSHHHLSTYHTTISTYPRTESTSDTLYGSTRKKGNINHKPKPAFRKTFTTPLFTSAISGIPATFIITLHDAQYHDKSNR